MTDRIEIAHMAVRLRRAILTLRALPDRERRWLYSQAAAWPEIVRDVQDAYGYAEAQRPRFVPTSTDVDDLIPAMELLAWLGRQNDGARDVRVIWARAFDVPWWKLAHHLGRSERQIVRWYDAAVTKIWCESASPSKNLVA